MSKEVKTNIKISLDLCDLAEAAARAAIAFQKLAWAYIRAKYNFTTDFSDN